MIFIVLIVFSSSILRIKQNLRTFPELSGDLNAVSYTSTYQGLQLEIEIRIPRVVKHNSKPFVISGFDSLGRLSEITGILDSIPLIFL